MQDKRRKPRKPRRPRTPEQRLREKLLKMHKQELSVKSRICYRCGGIPEPSRVARAIAIDASYLTCCACAKRYSDARNAALVAILRGEPQGSLRYYCGLCRERGHNVATCHNASAEQACAWYGVPMAMLHVQH